MRCTQMIGLTEEAIQFIDKNVQVEECSPCPHCGKPTSKQWKVKDWKDGSDAGMFEDGPMLQEYELKDGSKVRELIQAVPWSSGPCIFLCLEDGDGKRMFEHSQEDINNA